jgi:hypothetical protein
MLEKLKIKLFATQPIAKVSERDITAIINKQYPENASLVLEKLQLIEHDSISTKNRIKAAILKLANRDLDRIDSLVDQANTDFRDVLAPAEYPRNSKNGFTDQTKSEDKREYIADWVEYEIWLNTYTQ